MHNIFVVIGILLFAPTLGAEDVFLDFTTDIHNGSGGAANGIADWIDELNQATASAGVADFTPAERTTIEANIKTDLETMFAEYEVDFSTTVPASSPYDTINFGVEASGSVLGFAPLDTGNLHAGQVTNVAPEAFGFFIESGDARAAQITEISLGLAGTAAHELGHSVGLHHHHAYSNEGITPANYGATGGLQNEHIIATGSTGLNEIGRETLRVFSPFSKAMLDLTGGATSLDGLVDNESLVISGITSDTDENGTISTLGTDAGSTTGTAFDMDLLFEEGPSVLRKIVFVEADLDVAGNADVDVYKFEVVGESATLVAHLFSSSLGYTSSVEFDPVIELLDSGGGVLASNDDALYSGNTFGAGGSGVTDSFLVNYALPTTGTYYLRVTPFSGGELGSNYWLVAMLDDPTIFCLAAPDTTINGVISYTGTTKLQSETILTTSGMVTVLAGADVTYEAATSISLGPGFSVADGGVFQAQIAPVSCPVL